MSRDPEYYVVGLSFGGLLAYRTWQDALDVVGDASNDGYFVWFVHHIGPGDKFADMTNRALDHVEKWLYLQQPITDNQYSFAKHHFSAKVADSYGRVS